MSTLPSTFERNRLRQSLLRLASLLVMTFLACGLTSLFALWSMQRLHIQTQARQAELLHALNSARVAQVAFKIQVQSWKNLLLRGQQASDYDTALAEFESAERSAQEHLSIVNQWAKRAGETEVSDQVNILILQHASLGPKYRTALPPSARVNDQRAAADGAVRGIDRPINNGLDHLVAMMLDQESVVRKRVRADEDGRFFILSKLIWISLGLSIAFVSLLLTRTLRDPALRA